MRPRPPPPFLGSPLVQVPSVVSLAPVGLLRRSSFLSLPLSALDLYVESVLLISFMPILRLY